MARQKPSRQETFVLWATEWPTRDRTSSEGCCPHKRTPISERSGTELARQVLLRSLLMKRPCC